MNKLMILVLVSTILMGGYMLRPAKAAGIEEPTQQSSGIVITCKVVQDIIYPSLEVKPVIHCAFKRS